MKRMIQLPLMILFAGILNAEAAIVGGNTLNGNFNNGTGAPTADAWTFNQTSYWKNIGTGNQGAEATRSNLDFNGTRNAAIAQSATRKLGLDTGHVIAPGDQFSISYVWRDAFNWDANEDQVQVQLFITDDDTLGGSQTRLAEALSGYSTKKTTYETVTQYGIYTADASVTGKTLFVSIDAVKTSGTGTLDGFARLDNFVLDDAPPPAIPTNAMNIVFLFSDDGGYADFGFQNALTGTTTEFKTPNLDALAAQSLVCAQGYMAASLCSPSRANLLTGRYAQRFGYDYNIDNSNTPEDGMPTSQVLIMERMKQIGYTTGVFGKWHIGREKVKQPANQGVDVFYGLWSGSRPYFGLESDVVKRIRDVDGTIQDTWINEPSFNGINPDPTLGRHVTDALGDEATRFIANHAASSTPFFLYVPFTSPHGPYTEAKAADIARFNSTSLTGTRKKTAALVYAMDRACGHILARLKDPNNDGDFSDSIEDKTIVVYTNDNGGPSGGEHSNAPLRGNKGDEQEGGIRVPMIIRIPDPDTPGSFITGTYTHPIITHDFFPTFIAAAGAPMTTPTDGVNLLPYLSGANTNAPHDTLFWRKGDGWAARKGDWKVHRTGTTIALAKLAADGTGEWDNLKSEYPDKYNELIALFTEWETNMQKPSATTSQPHINRFDRFRFRQGVAPSSAWGAADIWADPSDNNVTMNSEDAYANCSLEFRTKNDGSYVANNNLLRQTGLDFMLNEILFEGTFNGASNQSGSIKGNPLLFVDSLASQAPALRLNASKNTSSEFTFSVANDLILYDDLEISGDGELDYTISGDISSYDEPRSITKTGAAALSLTGNNTYGGATSIQGGTLDFANGFQTAQLQVSSGATLEMDLDDTITVDGTTTLDGTLTVHPGSATNAVLIQAALVSGTFGTVNLPAPPANTYWSLEYTPSNVVLTATLFDSDGDQLLDRWEMDQFGDLVTSSGGNDNQDGDRSSDLVEFLAGTSATNPASYFKTPLTDAGYGTIEVTFDGISNRIYTLETSTVLTNDWSFGGSVGPVPTNGPQTLRHTVPGNPPSVFGRIGISVD